MKNAKTAVVVTNRFSETGPTPILKCSARSGWATYGCMGLKKQVPDFTISFDKESINGYWGSRIPMSKEEAAVFDADFGIWFSS